MIQGIKWQRAGQETQPPNPAWGPPSSTSGRAPTAQNTTRKFLFQGPKLAMRNRRGTSKRGKTWKKVHRAKGKGGDGSQRDLRFRGAVVTPCSDPEDPRDKKKEGSCRARHASYRGSAGKVKQGISDSVAEGRSSKKPGMKSIRKSETPTKKRTDQGAKKNSTRATACPVLLKNSWTMWIAVVRRGDRSLEPSRERRVVTGGLSTMKYTSRLSRMPCPRKGDRNELRGESSSSAMNSPNRPDTLIEKKVRHIKGRPHGDQIRSFRSSR